MVGRKVTEGVILDWQPLGSGMTDTLVQHPDGSMCWYASRTLKPVDGLGPLPDRASARLHADAQAYRALVAIREDHVLHFKDPWPGAEFAKVLVGRALDAALVEVRDRIQPTAAPPVGGA